MVLFAAIISWIRRSTVLGVHLMHSVCFAHAMVDY